MFSCSAIYVISLVLGYDSFHQVCLLPSYLVQHFQGTDDGFCDCKLSVLLSRQSRCSILLLNYSCCSFLTPKKFASKIQANFYVLNISEEVLQFTGHIHQWCSMHRSCIWYSTCLLWFPLAVAWSASLAQFATFMSSFFWPLATPSFMLL